MQDNIFDQERILGTKGTIFLTSAYRCKDRTYLLLYLPEVQHLEVLALVDKVQSAFQTSQHRSRYMF